MLKKENILFVGAFKSVGKSGNTGGQSFACQSLIQSEILKEKINWILIDSTADTNLKRFFLQRLFSALMRITKFIFVLMFNKVDQVLIFSSNGFSFFEKISMLLIAKSFLFRKKVVFAPRSGYIKSEIENYKVVKQIAKFIIKKADKIICQSESWKLFYSQFNSNNLLKFVVLPNWIVVDENFKNERKLNSIPKILFIGSIEKNKGVIEILNALDKIKHLDFEFNWAGSGSFNNYVEDYIKEKKLDTKVKFLGWMIGEKKNKLLKEADIFLLPSFVEGYPNALIEALHYEVASIATNIGGIPDIIINNETGILVEPGNETQLANAIEYLIQNEEIRLHIGKNGRKRIMSNNIMINAENIFSNNIFELK